MRILMIGNSFTFVNNMPSTLADLTGAEVVHHTRSGARLAEHLNPNTKMGAKTQEALKHEKWDYVVLQEMSNGPITSKEKFLTNVSKLCDQIQENGATPILYATWTYQKDGKQLQEFGMDYDEMFHQMYDSYHEAAEQNHCLIADVGEAFYKLSESQKLYAEDGCHPNEVGSRLVAEIISTVIADDQNNKQAVSQTEDIVIECKADGNDTRLNHTYFRKSKIGE